MPEYCVFGRVQKSAKRPFFIISEEKVNDKR